MIILIIGEAIMLLQTGTYPYLKGVKAISFFLNGIKVYIKKRVKETDKKPENFMIFEKSPFKSTSPYISSLFPTEDPDIFRLEYATNHYELEYVTDSLLEIRGI